MEVKDISLWVGLVCTISGAAVGYGSLTEKVAKLEADNTPRVLEARLVKLETRIEDNDIGKIGTEIQQLRGRIDGLAAQVKAIRVPSTSKIESEVKVLQSQIKGIEEDVKGVKKALLKPSNPLI